MIERRTKGLSKTKSHIPIWEFRKRLNIERQYVHEELRKLKKDYWIETSETSDGRAEYQGIDYINDKNARMTKFLCQKHGKRDKKTVTGFVPTPHEMEKIFSACSPAAVSIFIAAGEQMFDLDKKDNSVVVVGGGTNDRPTSLSWIPADYAEVTGLAEGSVGPALKELGRCEPNCAVGCKLHPGIMPSEPDLDHPGRMRQTIDRKIATEAKTKVPPA